MLLDLLTFRNISLLKANQELITTLESKKTIWCVNDIDNTDFIKIIATSKGQLASLYMGSVGAFNNIEFSTNACNEAIGKKLLTSLF